MTERCGKKRSERGNGGKWKCQTTPGGTRRCPRASLCNIVFLHFSLISPSHFKTQPSHFPRPAGSHASRFPTPTSTLSPLGAPYVESGQGYQREEGSGNKDRGGRKGEKGRGRAGYRGGKEGAVPELCSRVQSTKTSKTSCLHLKSRPVTFSFPLYHLSIISVIPLRLRSASLHL